MLCFPWEARDCCWAGRCKIFCLQVNKSHSLQISTINHFSCAELQLSSQKLDFSQKCVWKIFMCCLSKHNWKESTLLKLHCWFHRAKPTVSYKSPTTFMIRLGKTDCSRSCCSILLDMIFVFHKIFALKKLHVKNDIWKTIWSAAFLILLLIGLDFWMILILSFKLCWNSLTMLLSRVRKEPGEIAATKSKSSYCYRWLPHLSPLWSIIKWWFSYCMENTLII